MDKRDPWAISRNSVRQEVTTPRILGLLLRQPVPCRALWPCHSTAWAAPGLSVHHHPGLLSGTPSRTVTLSWEHPAHPHPKPSWSRSQALEEDRAAHPLLHNEH